MIRWLSISIALVAFVGSAVRLYAAESETFRGTAARSGTYKRPLLDVDGKRYELKASDKADAAVAEALDKFSNVFVPHRPKGAQLAWLERQGIGHAYDENRQDLLAMPLLDLAVRTRYPKDGDVTKGPIKLLYIDSSTGWVADNTTWKSGLTRIVPAKEFEGDLGHSSWLQNEDIAFIYRAYATYDNPLTITSPGPCRPGTPPVDPGSNVVITVDASEFPNWRRLDLYDGAKKLETVTAAPPSSPRRT